MSTFAGQVCTHGATQSALWSHSSCWSRTFRYASRRGVCVVITMPGRTGVRQAFTSRGLVSPTSTTHRPQLPLDRLRRMSWQSDGTSMFSLSRACRMVSPPNTWVSRPLTVMVMRSSSESSRMP